MRFHRHSFRGRGHGARTRTHVGAAVAALCAGATLAGAPAFAADAVPSQQAAPPTWQQDGAKDGPRDGKRGHRHGGHGMGHGGPGMMIPGMMHPRMLERMADELALTTEQRQTIRGFFDAAKPGMQDLTDQLRANAKQLMDVTPDDPRYSTVVQQASQDTGALTAQLIQQAAQVRTQVYGVLTPDQKQKLAAKQAEMRKRMEERRSARQERRGKPRGPDASAPPSGG